MSFASLNFLVLLAAAIGLYFLIPTRFRWAVLLVCSLGFYACAGVQFFPYLLLTAATVYGAALWLGRVETGLKNRLREDKPDKAEKKALRKRADLRKRLILAACVCVNVGVLAVVKYFDFGARLAALLLARFGLEVTPPVLGLMLPLGISFYTFQSIGYLTDVYRGMTEEQKNPLKLLLFLSFFPCVTQGPINRYNDFAPTLFAGNRFSYDRATRGAQRMLWGFFEKLVVADRLNIAVSAVFAADGAYNGAQLWVTMVLYAVQIYADFQGYMDIACGVAEIFGVKIAENFDSPYLSASVPEFWRRWHISLGAWFRDYVYYPIMRSGWFTGIRKKTRGKRSAKAADRLMTVFALMVVWGLTGLWHGARLTYLAWGLYYGVLLALSTLLAPLFQTFVEKTGLNRERRSYRLLQIAKTFLIVCIGYVLFRSESLHQASAVLERMLTATDAAGFMTLRLELLKVEAFSDCSGV